MRAAGSELCHLRNALVTGSCNKWLCMQALTIGPEVAGHFAEAMTVLCRLEADPVDPATLVGADLPRVDRLMEVLTP